MSVINPIPAKTASESPLESLQALLTRDMNEVNRIIIDQMQSSVPLIPQLAGYLIAARGKRIRPLMTLAATMMYQGDMTRAHNLSACVEFIHTATLLHDDVVDASDERRGQASANNLFGNEASVLVGDFLFSRAFQMMVKDGSLEVLKVLSDAAATISEGEVLQLSTQSNMKTSMEDYIKVVEGKTAALFAAACEVGPLIAKAGTGQAEIMRAYGMALGIAFQIADDVLDYSANQEKLGKAVGDDFREGKMTAPILMALAEADESERAFWTRTMGERIQTDEDLGTAQALLLKHDALKKGLDLALQYAEKAQKILSKAPPGLYRDTLAALALYTVRRDF